MKRGTGIVPNISTEEVQLRLLRFWFSRGNTRTGRGAVVDVRCVSPQVCHCSHRTPGYWILCKKHGIENAIDVLFQKINACT